MTQILENNTNEPRESGPSNFLDLDTIKNGKWFQFYFFQKLRNRE